MISPCDAAWLPHHQHGLYASVPNFDVTSKTGAPLKHNSSFPVSSMALQGVPLTAGGLIIPRQSPVDVNVQAAQLAASHLFAAAAANSASPEERRRNKNYKTELCRPYEESGYCKYADKCQFAHGQHELQTVPRHPKFKTEPCKNYHQTGYCPYGKRCHFVHNEDMRRNFQQQQKSQVASISAPFTPVAQPLVASPQVLSIQPNYTACSLGSAGDSPVPSSAGSESPNSFSPGLPSSSDEDPFLPPPPMTFPGSRGFADPKSYHFVFPSPSGKFASTSEDVDVLASGLEDMFVPQTAFGSPETRGNSRLTVFRRLTSAS